MNVEKLKQALQEMPETGSAGFEGLLKRLLELSLNEQFVLARAGDQPSGDAHNKRRNICVQAKRYTDASPQAKNIEGDFDENLRALPNTDIYILGVTRDTAQLNDTLEAMREKSAVDVVVWDFGSNDSALPVLCAEYWAQLQEFPAISGIDAELSNWASTTRITPSHKERLGQLHAVLRECTQTLLVVGQAARSYLARRFQIEPNAEHLPLQPIRLLSGVDRPGYRKQAVDWWTANHMRVLVVSAPEGYGKTWVAAKCAWDISEQENSIVLWLDSIQWRDCASVDAVLNEAVSRVVSGGAEKKGRLVRKLRERWSGRTLVILDGVNERNALPAAQKILEDLTLKHPGTCRFLFTTRPLDLAPGFEPLLWRHWAECKVEPFDGPELNAALAQAQIPPEELTDQLRRIARIPRYFATCLRLRDRLRKFDNISVALVLWTDLLEKINGLEPAIREALGFTSESDAAEVLVKLATSLPEAAAKGEAQELLNRCFGGKYAEVRNYLTEIRIMEEAGVFEATLSQEHTILGRALLLQQVFRSLQNSRIRDAADRLLETLEPLAGEDGSAEALFVALQLTADQQAASDTCLSKQRAALLFAWVFSHNSNASDERLAFWCGYDTDAYARFLEAFFEQLYAGNAQEFVVNPLSRLWRGGGSAAVALERYLRQWLVLVWFEGCSGDHIEHKGHKLPVATTADQVRLTSLVISLLSIRPETSFLSELALCLATESLTWRQVQQHRHQFKSVYENVGILMRWHFTERVLPELDRLAAAKQSDELLLDGIRRLASVLRIVTVPEILRLPPPKPIPHYFGTPAVELIRQGCRVFEHPRTEPYPNEMNFSHLAVRDDLPPLSTEDVAVVCDAVKEICTRDALHSHVERTLDDSHMDALWPWFAKHRPLELAELAGDLQLNALKREQPHETQPMFWFLAGVLPKLDDDEVLQWEQLANAKAANIEVANGRLKSYVGLSLAEAAFLLLPEEALHRWFVASAHDVGRRYSMCFSPLMDLIPLSIPHSTRLLAVEKCFELAGVTIGSAEGPPTELEYWCYIAGLTTGPDAKVYAWAKQQLLQQAGNGKRSFSLLRLWLRSAPAGALEADLRDPAVAELFDEQALRTWAISGDLTFDPKLLVGSYEELIDRLPQGFVGGVCALSERKADLNRWGQELFAVALRQLGKPPFERRSRVETQLRLGANRTIRTVGFESPPSESCAWSSMADSWGVDYGSPKEAFFGQHNRQQLLDDELDRWRLDEDQIQKWEHYEFHTFGAWAALEAWSKSYPEEFLPRAKALLTTAVGNPATEWHLGGFLHAVICCLLPFSPNEAWEHFVALNTGLHLSVRSDYDVPEFFAVLWDLDRCTSPQHDDLRRQLFARCRNEFEVMVGAVAALANHAETRLMEFADESLRNEVARERALGVSLLAWVGTQESADLLGRVVQADASRWVRRHAEWAKEVSLQERSGRAFFRQLACETDPYRLSAGLQVLKPALTPLARWWATAILREEKKRGLALAPKAEAILESFWYHIESSHKSHVEVCGRKLDKFCRGEKLNQLKVSKLAPWWEFR